MALEPSAPDVARHFLSITAHTMNLVVDYDRHSVSIGDFDAEALRETQAKPSQARAEPLDLTVAHYHLEKATEIAPIRS